MVSYDLKISLIAIRDHGQRNFFLAQSRGQINLKAIHERDIHLRVARYLRISRRLRRGGARILCSAGLVLSENGCGTKHCNRQHGKVESDSHWISLPGQRLFTSGEKCVEDLLDER